MTVYWATLFAAITTSMAGQALLKAGAGAVDFITQLFDWRTLFGFCPVRRRGSTLHRGAAPHSDVARAALHGGLLCRRGADRALRVRRGTGRHASGGDRIDLQWRGGLGVRVGRIDPPVDGFRYPLYPSYDFKRRTLVSVGWVERAAKPIACSTPLRRLTEQPNPVRAHPPLVADTHGDAGAVEELQDLDRHLPTVRQPVAKRRGGHRAGGIRLRDRPRRCRPSPPPSHSGRTGRAPPR